MTQEGPLIQLLYSLQKSPIGVRLYWYVSEADIAKVYKHTEGNANPQKLTEPYFRMNIIFTMLAPGCIFILNTKTPNVTQAT